MHDEPGVSEVDRLAEALFTIEANPNDPSVGQRMWANLVRRVNVTEWHNEAQALLASTWLAEHDHEVRTQWEMLRKPDPFIVENIEGEAAGAFLKRAKAEAWEEGYREGRDDEAHGYEPQTNPYTT